MIICRFSDDSNMSIHIPQVILEVIFTDIAIRAPLLNGVYVLLVEYTVTMCSRELLA